MQIKDKPAGVALRQATAPGRRAPSPEIRQAISDTVDLQIQSKAPDPGLKGSFWTRALTGVLAGVAGFTALAPSLAQAAPIGQLVTQSIAETDGLEVTVLPRGTARIDVLRKLEYRPGSVRTVGGRRRVSPQDVSQKGYTDVGVHLGRGLFHDTNGNLVLVPTMAAGWNDAITDFTRVDMHIPGPDDTVTRFGHTVHHTTSAYNRSIYVETSQGRVLEHHKKGDKESLYQVLGNGVQYVGDHGALEWRVTSRGENAVFVDGPGDQDMTITYGDNGIDLVGGDKHNAVSFFGDRIEVKGDGSDYQIFRSPAGAIMEVKKSGALNDATIIRDGNDFRTESTFNTSRILVDSPEFLQNQTLTYGDLVRQIEEAEPGYAEKHPLVMGLLEYAVANPGLMGEDEGGADFLSKGTGLATGGGALASGKALVIGNGALTLADNARALAAQAARAQAAAQMAAQAGQLTEAAALGGEAKLLAGQARAVGNEAMKMGEAAKSTAQVARILTGVAGTLEVIDGGMDLHKGASNKSIIHGAIVMTEALKEKLSTEQNGAELEQTMEDYSKVMEILEGLKKNADKQIRVGGMKIGCGGLMLISALAGGAVIPPIVGAVGLACTVGTAAYEHWDELKAFFTGDHVEVDPNLLDVLPDNGEGIILRMDSPDLPAGSGSGGGGGEL